MTGYLPTASETSSDEVRQTKAADALPSVPTTHTAMQRSALLPQTSVLSTSLDFWS